MPLQKWPVVLDEIETIQKLQEGFSLSRHGDGENALARGGAYVREPACPALARELSAIIGHADPRCLVGIPRLHPELPKNANWLRRAPAFLPFLSPDIPYVSAFISRPDSAPAIATVAYAQAMQALWQGKKVVLLAEETSKLRVVVPPAARKTVWVECPHREAYALIDHLEHAILRARPAIVLLSCGPTASCLAHRLACQDIQAIDIGSVGGFLARMLTVQKYYPLFPAVLHHPDCTTSAALRARLEAGGFHVVYSGEKSDA